MPSREQLERLLQEDPDDVFLNFALGMALVKDGRIPEALARFDRALELDPRYTPAYLQKGTQLVAMGRREEARSAFHAGVATAKASGDAHAAKEMEKLIDSLG